jgi:putative transposase
MLRTYRYRVYPNKIQREQILKNIHACRFVYNYALETKIRVYGEDGKSLSWYDLNNLLKQLKQDHPFLKHANSQSLQQAVRRLHLAFQHFFQRANHDGKRYGYPKFKSKKQHRQSFDIPQFFTVDFDTRRVRLPKIGLVKTVFHRRFEGIPKTCTVVSTNSGKFFISIVVEDGKSPPRKKQVTTKGSVGIDVGLTTYATLSGGEKIDNHRHLQSALMRLRCLHQRLSRKKKGSKNRARARLKLARCYERVVNQRVDFQQKLSTRLIRENQAIIVESLNVRGLIRNRPLARHISDAAWASFHRMLKYKAEWYGVTFIAVGRFKATSQLCSACGFKYNALTLSEKEWICPKCHKQHDRDLNAAQNIKMMGLRSIIAPREPREEPVELSALAEPSKQEAPTFRAG